MTIGEPLPSDKGEIRLLRAGILASLLTERGHEVTWWTSTFDHWKKTHHFMCDTDRHLQSGLQLKFLKGCGYKKNISFRRIIDHILVARKFSRQAVNEEIPDIILCSLPTLELAVAATRYGKCYGVPVIIDVRDLWPDIFLEHTLGLARELVRIALFFMHSQARRACRDAFAITGNSPDFVKWGLGLAGRDQGEYDRYFPFGYVTELDQHDDLDKAMSFWKGYGIEPDPSRFMACFFGTIGSQFDIETVIDAGLQLEREGRNVKFVLCGVGERLIKLKERAGNSSAIIFPGWVGKAEIFSLMSMAQVGLAPYLNHIGFTGNLPNKPIEYMAGGLPIVSGLKGYLETLLKENECGETYEPSNAEALCSIIRQMDDNREGLTQMARNAKRLFDDKFNARKVYGGMIDYLQQIALNT